MSPEAFLANFGHVANAPGGVEKLRECILFAAINGMLVDQNSNDQPASGLLDEIAKAKQKLISGKGLKPPRRSKEQSNPPANQIRVPNGWEMVVNHDLFFLRKGKKPKTLINTASKYPYLDIEALDREHIRRYTDDEKCPRSTSKDLVIVCDGSRSGLILNGRDGVIGSTLAIVETPEFLQPYLKILFLEAFQRLNSTMKGAAIPHLDTKTLLSSYTKLPPFAEQKRIVEKVDALMALCDRLEEQQRERAELRPILATATHTRFTENPTPETLRACFAEPGHANPKELRKTILSLALRGELVARDLDEGSGHEVLEKLKRIRTSMIADKKLRKIRLNGFNKTDSPYRIPSNWIWAQLNDFIDVRDGTHDSPKNSSETDSVPLITSKDFSDGKINFSNAKRISLKDHLEISKRSKVDRYDILFSMIGGNIGNQVMVQCDAEFSVKNVALFKYYDKELSLPGFLKIYFEHLAFGLQQKAIGGAQPFVSLGQLRNLYIAVPPTAEQRRIVAKVDELIALVDKLEQQQARREEMAAAFAQAAVSALTGTEFKPKAEKMKAPKTELISMVRLRANPDDEDTAPLATLLAANNGELEAKTLWQRSGLAIENFYQQLKMEIAAGYLQQPEEAKLRELSNK